VNDEHEREKSRTTRQRTSIETTATQEQSNIARESRNSQLKNRRETELTLTDTDTERRNAKRGKPKENLA